MFGKNPFNEYRATQQQVQERTSAECNGMVCKNCGDTYGNPTEGSCMYDSKNPNGKNWMEAKATNEATQYVIPEDIPQQERTAFHGAAAAAAKAGKSHFNFAGKKHPVTMKKDTANAIADQKEGYYKDLEIKKQDKEMGAKPVPAKKKKEAKNGGKEGDVEMNPKMDTAKKENVSKIRESLMAVLSEKEDRKKHTPNEDKAEKMKDNRKGKGAEDMMAAADAEIAKGPDAHLNEPEIDKENFKKMTSNVKTAAKRNKDNAQGDTKIVPGGTQFKDPTAMKAESTYDNMSALKAAYASMYEEDIEENYTHEVDYAEDGKNTAKSFVDKAKKAGMKAKIHNPSGPGGGHPVVHLGHKDDDHVHKFLKKHYDPDMEKGDLQHHKI
jgi:hypothetical protein